MQSFKVHILGCGSALPTLKHYASSQVIEIRNKMFMIDCGEGTQIQLRRSKINFNKISAVFISHLHGDHCFGIIGLISTFGLLGRTAPLHIYAPVELKNILNQQIEFFCNGLDYDVIFHDIDTASRNIVYEDHSLTVHSIPLVHRVPCCGFLFKEKPVLPHIRRDMMDFYNIPVSQRNNIKNGLDWTTPDGDIIQNTRLTYPAESPRSYAYCSDTKYNKNICEQVKNVDLLYHEATYCDIDKDRANLYNHTTAKQAASVALAANVKKLIIGHYSARYENEEILLNEAKSIFANTFLTDEMKVFNV